MGYAARRTSICVPKPEAWGVKQEEEKETDKDLKKKDDVEKVKK